MSLKKSLEIIIANKVNQKQNFSKIGNVVSVDTDKLTCVVQCEDVTYAKVMLSVTDDATTYVIPKIDSRVIVSITDEGYRFISMFSGIDKYVNNTETDSQKKLLTDLLDVLKQFQLTTNQGSTIAVTPAIMVKLEQINQRVENFYFK